MLDFLKIPVMLFSHRTRFVVQMAWLSVVAYNIGRSESKNQSIESCPRAGRVTDALIKSRF